MPRYQWQENNAITQADVKENLQYRFAILHPREGITPEAMAKLPDQLQRHGLVAIPDVENDKPVLRVRGFKKSTELFAALKQEQLIDGPAYHKQALEEELNPEVKTFRKYLKEHSIQLAGAVYLIADAMPIFSGIVRKTPDEVAQGALWATTSMGLLLFGRKNPEVQMGNMYTRMKTFMAQEGVSLPDDQALAMQQLQRDPSYWNGMLNFLYEHPVLFNNSLQGLGGVKQAGAGRAQHNAYKTAAGISVAAGQWGGLIIPEDKYAGMDARQKAERLKLRAQGKEPENGFHTSFTDNPVAWIQEKPLRLTAIGPIIGNFLTTASALFHDRHKVNEFFHEQCAGFESKKFEMNPATLWRDARRGTNDLLRAAGVSKDNYCADKGLKSHQRKYEDLEKMVNTQIGWKFTMMTPVFNIIANTLYGMSSKEERSVNLDKEGYIGELIAVAANVYAQVPQDQRNEKIVRFAGFLKSQPDVNLNEADIRERLETQIAKLEQSQWVSKVANQNHPTEHAVGV